MRRLTMSLVAAMALLAVVAVPSAVANRVTTGLWPSTFQAGLTAADCTGFQGPDANFFCYAPTGEITELGVRFTTSTAVNILGVRIYRVTGGTVTGSLWNEAGTSLATGTFSTYSGSHGWQDLLFTSPVAITPRSTYTASYHVPGTGDDYAYQHNYSFPKEEGPIKTLSGSDNGVYQYCDPGPCFPTSVTGTNYWVTPLWGGNYTFSGFFQPVDNNILNTVKAGQAIPVKFSLGSDEGLNIFAAGYPLSGQIACGAGTAEDAIEQTVTAGSSSLSYDPITDQYTYVWKTDKGWANTCRQLVVELDDGTTHVANFLFKK